MQANPLQRHNIADIYPLSPMQEGILFHSISAPGEAFYMPQTALRLLGAVDGAALKAAWQAAIDRHAVLRSGFYWETRDAPFQIAFKHLSASFAIRDLPDADSAQGLERIFAENRAEPFDLQRPPLLRVQWIRTGQERSILVVCYHHIILDGWSIRALLEEVLALYRHETGAAGAALAPPRAYGDYIGWLKAQDRAAGLRFWQDRLDGAPKPFRLLAHEGSGPFARLSRNCPKGLHRAIREAGARAGHTLNTLLQGALALLLARQSGRSDVIFGTTTAGRPAQLAEAASMIGLFINTLPVRVPIEGQTSVRGWLDRLQARQAETIAHEHVPLASIQGAGGALFDTLLVVENLNGPTGGPTGRTDVLPFAVEPVDFDERTHFPLTLWALPRAAGLTLMAGYCRDALDGDTAAVLLDALMRNLAKILAQPDSTLDALLERLGPPLSAPGLSTPADPLPTEAADAAPVSQPISPAGARALTATEQRIARIWQEVLKSGPLGPDAHFFALGGHSLLGARVISRLRQEIAVPVPVRSLFERPVLSDLAAEIDRRAAPAEGHIEIEI
ncbi:hypothetical protein BJF92_18285 [Rhizobium rhizosphaerae]|uniref:Carrier domain-containing protein n=1 Tax=Xaviernesmea rhizosphaerae TaxID=1672749 RepID=A0A1Q9ADJ3_9HYPH|nr:condensation domain-containing protein [Xaviernesmea rhizosphaerae]OLP52988.1 hypothetical protein BJF92_18285 [Xaviernesmea rhizosphaerae]